MKSIAANWLRVRYATNLQIGKYLSELRHTYQVTYDFNNINVNLYPHSLTCMSGALGHTLVCDCGTIPKILCV